MTCLQRKTATGKATSVDGPAAAVGAERIELSPHQLSAHTSHRLAQACRMKMRVHPTLADACIRSLTQSCAHVHTRNHPSLGCCVTNTLRQPAPRRHASWAPPELWMRTCSHMQSHRPLQTPWTRVHEPLDKNPQKPQRGHRMGLWLGVLVSPAGRLQPGTGLETPRGQGR